MIISQYIVVYAIFAFAGWVFECILNVVREGTWENRGVLFGPSCPIYGVGVVGYLIAFDNQAVASGAFPLWGVFLAAAFGSAALEYATSVAMEKIFHARWWDYSNMPLNINGRVCLPASVLFGIGGVATAALLVPLFHAAQAAVPALAWEAAAVAIVAIFSVDATLSFSALTELLQKVEATAGEFDRAMETGVANAQEQRRRVTSAIEDGIGRASMAFRLFNVLTFGRMTSKLPSARRTAPPQAQEFVSGLSARQKRVFASIKGFSNSKAQALGDAGRNALHGLNAKIAERKRDKKASDERFAELAEELAEVPSVQKMREYRQHGSVSTYEHSMRVAQCAWSLSRKLPSTRDEQTLVRAGLLHDYFGYDWHETDNRGHAVNHPVIAAERACTDFGLSPKERNAILAHMWPLPPTRVPRSAEAWLICLADKACSLKETLFMR